MNILHFKSNAQDIFFNDKSYSLLLFDEKYRTLYIKHVYIFILKYFILFIN